MFLFQRSGVLGTLLLSSYLGGAIATHLQHQQNILFPMAIEAAVWITAIIRFPELTRRFGNPKSLNERTA
ncbi:integral membrane protein [Filimonas lacunae]|nr:integral membrane protein [Filimonas lacunae]